VATVQECAAALAELATRLGTLDESQRRKIPDRSLSLLLPDLERRFHARLLDGTLVDITDVAAGAEDGADVGLEMTSATLLALVDGEQSLLVAWSTRQLKIRAGWRDLLEVPRWFTS
jgi:hypothetical protein